MKRQRWLIVAIGMMFAVCVWAAWPTARVTNASGPFGAAISQLTNDPAIDVRPAWSPDERTIAFQSNRNSATFHIFLMNPDGSNQRPLTSGTGDDRHPIWTRDGKTILYDSFDGKERNLWSVNVADGSRKQLTQLGGLASFPSPSPDGKQIVFYLYQAETMNIWRANADGSNAKPLTTNFASARYNQCTFACHQAVWSADGNSLAYSGGDHRTIWLMQNDGTDAHALVADEDHHHFPWFLSDGRLGYITEHVSPVQSWTDAWAYNLQSKQKEPLQDYMSLQGPLEWSADNTKLLFHSPRAGNFDIFLIDLSAPNGVAALQGTPVPATRAESTTADTAPAPVATAAFVPAPGSTSEAATTDNASGLRWIAGIVMAGVVAAFVIALVRDRR